MAEEEGQQQAAAPKKKMNTKMLIIIIGAAVVFGTGIIAAISLFGGKGKAGHDVSNTPAAHGEESGKEGGKEGGKKDSAVLVPFEPFVVNLSAPGRYLKVTIHFELKNAGDEEFVKSKTPVLRDVVITLLSSKSADAVSGPEGKFQLKDEVLFRANQALGREIIKNLYFTEFVMQ